MLPIRNTQEVGLSIATGMSLSRFFKLSVPDDTRELTRVDLNDYELFYINIFTLIRNIIGSYDTPIRHRILNGQYHNEIIDILHDELHVIDNLFNDYKATPVLLIPDYSKLVEQSYHTVGNSKQREVIYGVSLSIIAKMVEANIPISVIKGRVTLPASREPTIILTHFPADLNNHVRLPQLELLESHTGVLKTNNKFNTKYVKFGKFDFTQLPFTEVLLYLLGDNKLFTPYPIETRKKIIEIAIKYRWTKFTSKRKVRSNLFTDPNIRKLLKKLKEYY